jgi:hypothetical protein
MHHRNEGLFCTHKAVECLFSCRSIVAHPLSELMCPLGILPRSENRTTTPEAHRSFQVIETHVDVVLRQRAVFGDASKIHLSTVVRGHYELFRDAMARQPPETSPIAFDLQWEGASLVIARAKEKHWPLEAGALFVGETDGDGGTDSQAI